MKYSPTLLNARYSDQKIRLEYDNFFTKRPKLTSNWRISSSSSQSQICKIADKKTAYNEAWLYSDKLNFYEVSYTVELGFNDYGYNEYTIITNKIS